MMTRDEALKCIKDAGYELQVNNTTVTNTSHLPDWYAGGTYHVVTQPKEKVKVPPAPNPPYSNEWYRWKWKYQYANKPKVEFVFNQGSHNRSCAVPVIGSFSTHHTVPANVLAAVLEIAKIANKRQGYLQAITLSQNPWKALNDALPLAGFEKRAAMRTKHAGTYNAIVWEWVETPEARKAAAAKKRSEAAKKAAATRKANKAKS